jgi:Zn finger protein HypA/HybF involved in hydrogenase expression
MDHEQKSRMAEKPVACSVVLDANNSGEHWRFCLRCGHELINEKCKLRCPRCHYFMSCSDFDFAN